MLAFFNNSHVFSGILTRIIQDKRWKKPCLVWSIFSLCLGLLYGELIFWLCCLTFLHTFAFIRRAHVCSSTMVATLMFAIHFVQLKQRCVVGVGEGERREGWRIWCFARSCSCLLLYTTAVLPFVWIWQITGVPSLHRCSYMLDELLKAMQKKYYIITISVARRNSSAQ